MCRTPDRARILLLKYGFQLLLEEMEVERELLLSDTGMGCKPLSVTSLSIRSLLTSDHTHCEYHRQETNDIVELLVTSVGGGHGISSLGRKSLVLSTVTFEICCTLANEGVLPGAVRTF